MASRYNPDIYHRRSIRLKGYDYSQQGAYFLTICTYNRECLFGVIADGEMRPNDLGLQVISCWEAIPDHFPHVDLDAFCLMPNHIHGVLVFVPPHVGATHASPLQEPTRACGPLRRSLGAIVGAFKSAVTRKIHERQGGEGVTIWQTNYYEHIIHDEHDLDMIRDYIALNPARWSEDRNNPLHLHTGPRFMP